MKTGQCLCGEVAFVIRGELGPIDHCHCSMCRRAHGAPCATFGRVRRDEVAFVRGAERVARYASSPQVERSFCSRCGTRLFFRHAALPEHEFVSIGSLDDQSDLRPVAHIFVGSKAPWHTITDALPQHAGYAPLDGA